jgi:hypothetical protein
MQTLEPTATVAEVAVPAKLIPATVRLEPPELGAFGGVTKLTTGASNVKRSSVDVPATPDT